MASSPRNIVICLDGTGNQIEENLSNVLKLYRTLEKTDEQIVFYDQGVGTLGRIYTWGWLKQKLKNLLGLAFGLGLDKNVLKAYEFLVEHYQEHKVGSRSRPVGDNIYIFGFSRGAHTARVLAGLIYEIGILRPNQVHLSGAALTAYKQSKMKQNTFESGSERTYEGEGANFRRVANTRTASVRFLGIWDTVSSVFVPNSTGFFPPVVREHLPHTLVNPAVRACRQAIAIDEKRRMFRVDHWEPDQIFKPNPHSQGTPAKQDASEFWFAGYHSDIGGGHKRADSGLSQIPLIWMIGEAKKDGLKVSDRMAKYVTGVKKWSSTTEYIYPKPDPAAQAHDSMTRRWKWFEYLPKHDKLKEWPERKSFLGFYLPMSEPRFIEKSAKIHPSVKERMKALPEYKPVNLPAESAK